MKSTSLFLLFLSLSALFISCSDEDKDSDTLILDKNEVHAYVDYVHPAQVTIQSGEKDYKITVLDESIVKAVVPDGGSVIAVTPLKKGKTTVIIEDKKGKKAELIVTTDYMLYNRTWNFFEYSLEIECDGDNSVYNAILDDINNNRLIQCSQYGGYPHSKIGFKTPDEVVLKKYKGNDFTDKPGKYTYDYPNLSIQFTGDNQVMNCNFSIVAERTSSWEAYLVHDLTQEYKATYPKVTKVNIKYVVSAAKYFNTIPTCSVACNRNEIVIKNA